MSDLAARVEALGRKSAARSAERQAEIEAVNTARAEAMEAKRAQLRESMPRTAAFVDLLRERFGDVRVLAAKEGEKSVINRAACERARVNWREYV